MVSSVPKPPQRIRVEMPAEIAPQPVPETLLITDTALQPAPAEQSFSSKIHVIHPAKMEEEPGPPVEQLETEAAIATSAEPIPEIEETAKVTAETEEADDDAKISNAESGTTDVKNSLTGLSVPPDEVLLQKQYYTIGEVAEMFGANQSQIRFWENEFEILQPKKNKKGDRHFRPEDIKNLVLIRHLLQERRFTIEGAKEHLKKKAKRLADRHQAIQQLERLKGFLLEMKANLGEAAV